jgi:hypothetical protein
LMRHEATIQSINQLMNILVYLQKKSSELRNS